MYKSHNKLYYQSFNFRSTYFNRTTHPISITKKFLKTSTTNAI